MVDVLSDRLLNNTGMRTLTRRLGFILERLAQEALPAATFLSNWRKNAHRKLGCFLVQLAQEPLPAGLAAFLRQLGLVLWPRAEFNVAFANSITSTTCSL
jgi:hypothetical protein